MLVASYSRVSSQRQEQEQTIETQILAIKDYAKENNLTIVKEYRDEGWSGTILARPSLDELRIEAKNKLWEGVIIYDPDRLARKYSYQSLLLDELEEAGIKVFFITTPPAKTDEDKLLYGVKGLFAEYERARITDRFRLGKLRKAREGNIVTTEAPYGYFYIKKQGQKQGYLKINQSEASVVKMIFSWIGEKGLTMREVVRRLQELKIAPRKSKKKVWNTSTLVNLLRNETYIGKAHYHKSYAVVPEKPLKQEKYKKVKKSSRKMRPVNEWIEIPTPKIISVDLFEKTRQQLKDNFELSNRNKKNQYLLSGRIYCSCGKRRTGEGPQKGKHLYYRCSDRVSKFPLKPTCFEKGVNARIADNIVWDKLSRLMISPELIKKQAERWLNTKRVKTINTGNSIEGLENELVKLKNEEERYLKVFGAELMSFENLQDFLAQIKTKREGIQGQIKALNEQSLNVPSQIPTSDQINILVEQAKKYLPNLGFETKQAIVRKLVDKIVAKQNEMTIYGYLPIGKESDFYFSSINRHSGVT
ncbi:MAG: recombinase family protein [Patescibacteria group bacterium]|nr:recombinase family protein [Patescibacteria group bacterium]